MADTKDDRTMIAQIKGSSEFRDWIRKAAKLKRMTVIKYLEYSAVETARRESLAISDPPLRTTK